MTKLDRVVYFILGVMFGLFITVTKTYPLLESCQDALKNITRMNK